MKPPPDNDDWLETECVCCGRPEHIPWYRLLLQWLTRRGRA